MGVHGRAAIIVLLLTGVALLILPRMIRRAVPVFLYHPAPLSAGSSSPSHWGVPRGEEVWLEAADGVRLHGWWITAPSEGAGRGTSPAPAAPGPGGEGLATGTPRSCGVAVFFHGNAGHLADRAQIARRLSRRGLDVLLVDYRGYGRSEGEPTEEGLYADGMAAYRYLVDGRGVAPERVLVAGHSLGGAVAVAVASRADVAALVVTAAFRTLPDIARDLYPWLPGSWFEWSPVPFPTLRRMPDVSGPALVGRGDRDHLIPRSHVRALYEAAPDPKRWVEVPGAGHNDLWFDEDFWGALDEFLGDALGCESTHAR